jgi:hypothetical protein
MVCEKTIEMHEVHGNVDLIGLTTMRAKRRKDTKIWREAAIATKRRVSSGTFVPINGGTTCADERQRRREEKEGEQ